MILDTLSMSDAYLSVHPLFKHAFEYLRNLDLSTVSAGKVVLIEDALTVAVMDITGKNLESAKLEAHKKFIDIQLVIQGVETMGWAPLQPSSQELAAYNPEKDLIFYTERPSSLITVYPGQFAVFFPSDCHAPGVGEGSIRKAVVKVLV